MSKFKVGDEVICIKSPGKEGLIYSATGPDRKFPFIVTAIWSDHMTIKYNSEEPVSNSELLVNKWFAYEEDFELSVKNKNELKLKKALGIENT